MRWVERCIRGNWEGYLHGEMRYGTFVIDLYWEGISGDDPEERVVYFFRNAIGSDGPIADAPRDIPDHITDVEEAKAWATAVWSTLI